MIEESPLDDTVGDLNTLLNLEFEGEDKLVYVDSKEFIDEVEGFIEKKM
jgi:hypothetical protein